MQVQPGPVMPGQIPPPKKTKPAFMRRAWVISGLAVLTFVIGLTIGLSSKTTVYKTRTVTQIQTVPVPGPTITDTAPPSGAVIGTWSGTGNSNTPAFNAPASGDYIVTWSYSNNQGSNFIITATDQGANGFGLPNDIQSSGSGSTEVTGASGTESFNVQAVGSWTIKVVSA